VLLSALIYRDIEKDEEINESTSTQGYDSNTSSSTVDSQDYINEKQNSDES
jgi:hypothetical protein